MKSFKVKIINGTGLEELKGETTQLNLNDKTGIIELARPGAELPFFGIGWNEVTEITYETKGMLRKGKIVNIKGTNQTLTIEIKEKTTQEEIQNEFKDFLEKAKKNHPKGTMVKALEPLKEAVMYFQKAAQQAIENVTKKTTESLLDAKDKATIGLTSAKDKATDILKKQKED